jgi:uncharacterized protein DUF5994
VWVIKSAPFPGFAHFGRRTAEDGSAGMMSVPRVVTASERPPRPLRSMLKSGIGPSNSATGFVDGAWWPYSRDLAAEAPALAKSLRVCLGKVERISYNLGAWELATRKVRVGGSALRLAGYHSQHADTIDVLGRKHRITLLVVPPEAGQVAGRQAMELASTPANTNNPIQLLVQSGVRRTTPHAAAATGNALAPVAEDTDGRWDTDGGRIYERL